MKAMHDVLGEVEIINASEGLTVLIEHDGQTKEVLRRSVVPLPAAELARREQAQHTPGPWRVADDYSVETVEGRQVAHTGGYSVVGEMVAIRAENRANAALIARAPELLAENARLRSMLAAIVAVMDERYDDERGWRLLEHMALVVYATEEYKGVSRFAKALHNAISDADETAQAYAREVSKLRKDEKESVK